MTEKILQLNTEKNIFWTLLAILVASAFFYSYSINATIHNIVSRQNFEAKASQLTISLSAEEYQYIGIRNKITLSFAHSLGFKDVSTKTFISNNPHTLVSYLSH